MKIRSIGIDPGKTTFHLVALGDHGTILLKKKLSRTQLMALTANLPASLIANTQQERRPKSRLHT